MKRVLLSCAVLLTALPAWMAGRAAPQTQPAGKQAASAPGTPQAKTLEEYDAYQKFWSTADPDQKILLAEEFLKKFPASDLKVFAYRKEMEAYQQKNDFERMKEFGEKILAADPSDVIALTLLATAIPERTLDTDPGKDRALNAAEEYARRALSAIDKLEKPSAQYSDPQWEQLRNQARSQAWGALGLVNLQRRNYAASEEAFQKATQLATDPDPVLWFRASMALRFSKKYEEALAGLKKCVEMGGVKLQGKDLCVEERNVLQKYLDERKAATPAASKK